MEHKSADTIIDDISSVEDETNSIIGKEVGKNWFIWANCMWSIKTL